MLKPVKILIPLGIGIDVLHKNRLPDFSGRFDLPAQQSNLPFFSIKGLHKNFGGVIATNNVSIDINKNEIFGIIGPNGAGKTTLFNMITGVYHPSEGHIFLESTQLDGMPVHKIAQAGVARTFQNIRLFSDLTCYENVKTSCQKNVHYGFLDGILRTSRCRSEEARLDNECKEYLREVGLWEQANVLARNLPYGMQRRLEIARAMVTFPKLLLLDEPAAGMNEEESRQLTEIIKELRDKHDVTIIIIDHHMDVIMDVCDKITVINFGTQIATGAPESIQSNPDVIAAYLGGE